MFREREPSIYSSNKEEEPSPEKEKAQDFKKSHRLL